MSQDTKTTLAIDVGGSGIKSLLLDPHGEPLCEPLDQSTPERSTPDAVVEVIVDLARRIGEFDRVSVGFPGVCVDGLVYGAVNLSEGWDCYPLQERLENILDRPVRVANDADVQGLGAIEGKGVELVFTLGTGLGSALFLEGQLLPNMEFGHLPYADNSTFEKEVADRVLKRIGADAWRSRVLDVIAKFRRTFNYRQLFIGGGNARLLTGVADFELPEHVTLVSNRAGLTGGIALWEGIPKDRPVPLLHAQE